MKIWVAATLFFYVFGARAETLCDLAGQKWNPLPYDSNGVYHPGCEPQILYSWLTSQSVIDASDAKWPIRRGIGWFARTPLSSFLYGDYSFRVKLKRGVQFKIENDYDQLSRCNHPKKEERNTVYIRYINDERDVHDGFSEYVICSNDPIESWSFGMPEHLAEMERERNLVQTDGFQDGLMKPQKNCKDCFLGYSIVDTRKPADRATVDAAIALMSVSVAKKEGRVFVMETGLSYESGDPVDQHFQTSFPLPFHMPAQNLKKPTIQTDDELF